jgi:hypothetical protein
MRQALRGATRPEEVYDYYVDASRPDDNGNGLTHATAFKTITAALAATSDDRTKSVGLRRGQRHLPNTDTDTVFGVKGLWGGYGTGHMPFVDCSLPVTVGDIEPHATLADVYVVEITHATAPSYTGSTTASFLLANGPHFGLWWETVSTGIVGDIITPTYDQPDLATAESFVAANPGRMFVQKIGSSEMDARKETSGSSFRYVFQLPDSADPRTGGTLRYGNYHSTKWTVHPGAITRGIIFGRNTLKDIHGTANIGAITGELPIFEGCGTIDPGCHGFVGPSHWRKCLAFSRTPGSAGAGGGWHNYTGVFESRVPTIYDCLIDGFGNSIYSHGASQNPVIQSLSGARLVLRNATTAFEIPTVDSPASFSDIVGSGIRTVMQGEAHVSRFALSLKGVTNFSNIFVRPPAGKIEDGVIFYDASAMASSSRVIVGANLTTQAAAEAYGTPTIRRVTFANSPLRVGLQSTTHQWLDLVVEDSVVGRTVVTTNTDATTFVAAATLQNSYIGPTANNTTGPSTFANLAAYQVKVPGAANDVILYDGSKPVTFAGDPLIDPTITGPAEILGLGMGVDPAIILALPAKLANVPTLASMGLAPT